ncbi:MAG: TonB-dependent receptor plug domain-containing protein [Verrucomicrobia bacterium]|nr:TonB-dependent receptor plug domain-containing protein [Verrucomicrobiota bacterium]
MPPTPRLLLPTLLLALSPTLFAQVAPAPAAAAKPAPAPQTEAEKAAAEKKQKAADEAVLLTVFEVKADGSDTYDATNTNSVTGTNTALNKTPLDAKVFNRQLMDELGIVDMTEMLSKLGGLGPAVINAGDDVRGMLEGDRQDPKSMTMRGLQINNPRRDGFLRSDTTLLDSFDIERVEAIGGSNSLLFGSGDAGGVITSASKRAYLNRRATGTVTAMGDSEGSRRYTLDAQAGGKYFGVRLNAVTSDLLNFRPGLRQQAEGLHLTTTIQPFKRLQIRGEYRHYTRDTVFAQAVIINAPTNLLLPATDPLGYPTINSNKTNLQINGSNSRYLVGLPAAQSFLNGVFDVTKVDSATGPFTRDAYVNTIRSVVAEATLAEGLAVQVRYGHDARINDALRSSTTTVFAPGATGNLYVNPATGQTGQDWAFNTSMTATPFWTGARGYRASVAYQKDLGKYFGRHQASVFHQDMDSWTNQQPWRFYEVDASGKTIQNTALITNAESGRNVMPATWIPLFPKQIIGGKAWRNYYVQHPNGKTYHYEPQIYSGAVTPTAGNPMGLSGGITAATGNSNNTTYTMDDTGEVSSGVSLFSEWWKGHVDTMAGYRREKAEGLRNHTGVVRPANSYDSVTLGTVVDTPVRGLRVSANYSTNAKINFDTTRDIYNASLPSGKGVSKDIGLKFDLFDRRISGNLNYYVSEGRNFIATLGNRDDIDPAGINGRNGGNGYTYSKTSDGFNVTLTSRPLRGWEVRLTVATSDGRERSDVTLPQFYNDQFNTTTVNGQPVVGVKATATSSVVPFMVPSDPADPASAQGPLSLAMLKDPTGPYGARLDVESGQILNAQQLGLTTPGIGTGVTGLPVSQHQLGFVSPSGGGFIARRAGEKTTGYAERAYSLINRFQISEGRLRGLVLGLSTSYQENYRAYMYNDMLDANKRKMFYLPNRFINDAFVTYRFTPVRRVRASVQFNVANLLDTNRILMLRSASNGAFRYAQWFNPPRKLSITTSLSY